LKAGRKGSLPDTAEAKHPIVEGVMKSQKAGTLN